MLKKYILKIYGIALITLFVLILLKSNQNFRSLIYKYVYTENFSFASVNNWYNSKFGNPLPFSDLLENSVPVFDEVLEYSAAHKYKDGVALSVDFEYLIPALDNGIIIFVGEKEGYGKTVIVQQENGVDIWYANVSEANVKLYDYIQKGELIGNASEVLYLVFIKDGEVINYEEYI